jgi:hypothetical protein
MNIEVLTKEDYQDLVNSINEIKLSLSTKETVNNMLLDNSEFIKLMSISKKTAQTWRDEGIVAFSQIKGKIYYSQNDVTKLLESHHNPCFKKFKQLNNGGF